MKKQGGECDSEQSWEKGTKKYNLLKLPVIGGAKNVVNGKAK